MKTQATMTIVDSTTVSKGQEIIDLTGRIHALIGAQFFAPEQVIRAFSELIDLDAMAADGMFRAILAAFREKRTTNHHMQLLNRVGAAAKARLALKSESGSRDQRTKRH